MNTVERIKSICKDRKIAMSTLEKECGFSNGYVGQLKKGSMPDDRLRKVAEFLKVTTDFLMTGKETEFSIEMAETDVALSNMEKRVKSYALKLAALSEKDQEMIMQMIDRCENN